MTTVRDATYPDPNSGGYKGAKSCGTFKPASVISTSYGYNEADLTPAYEKRQCNEYMKLGLAGTTFLYSSGIIHGLPYEFPAKLTLDRGLRCCRQRRPMLHQS